METQSNKIWNRIDYLLFFIIVPLLLGFIYLLPSDIKEQAFLFYPKNPNLLSAFLSNYTHSTLDHIGSNILVYLITMGFIFVVENDKKTFYRVMAFSFLILPFLLSWVTLQFLHTEGSSQGFSGIAAALIGYCAFAIYSFFKKHGVQADTNLVMMIFFINAIVSVSDYWLKTNILFAAFMLVLLGAYTYWNRKALLQIIDLLKNKIKEAKGLHFLVRAYWSITVLFAILLLFLALPALISTSGFSPGQPFPNIIAHYFGYVSGMFLPVFIENGGQAVTWLKSKIKF